jgi:hypothetical protein
MLSRNPRLVETERLTADVNELAGNALGIAEIVGNKFRQFVFVNTAVATALAV